MCIINIIWNLCKYLNFFISINFWNRSFLSHFVYFWLFLIDSTITYDWKNCFDHLSMLKIYWSALSTNFILAAEVSMLVSTTILPLSPSASPIYFPGICQIFNFGRIFFSRSTQIKKCILKILNTSNFRAKFDF